MSSDTLAKIKETLAQLTNLKELEIDSICELLRLFHIGMWLYPGVIARKVPLSIEQTYAVTDALEKKKYIKSYYELYCNNCQKATGQVYATLNDLPVEFECEICHANMISIQNSLLVYQVIAE